MTGPTRRALLSALGTYGVAAIAGCLGSSEQDRDPPEYDCDSADRPEPSAPDREDAIEPAPYPNASELLESVDSVREYERVYRRNSLVGSKGDALVGFGTSNVDTKEYRSPDGATVVRVEYQFYYETNESGDLTVADSPVVYATYYVDESVVVRAESRGGGGSRDGLDPDPWESGDVVECLE